RAPAGRPGPGHRRAARAIGERAVGIHGDVEVPRLGVPDVDHDLDQVAVAPTVDPAGLLRRKRLDRAARTLDAPREVQVLIVVGDVKVALAIVADAFGQD